MSWPVICGQAISQHIGHLSSAPILKSYVCVASMISGFLPAQNSNSSQFYISFAAAPQCDGKHVVVGTVTDGLEVLRRIGAPLGTQLAPTWRLRGTQLAPTWRLMVDST